MKKKFLTRPEAAEYLTGSGLPISKNTLQKFASVGGGPLYVLFGSRALYRTADLDLWAIERIGAPRRSTSEVAEDGR